jgi:hypothetical protein
LSYRVGILDGTVTATAFGIPKSDGVIVTGCGEDHTRARLGHFLSFIPFFGSNLGLRLRI